METILVAQSRTLCTLDSENNYTYNYTKSTSLSGSVCNIIIIEGVVRCVRMRAKITYENSGCVYLKRHNCTRVFKKKYTVVPRSSERKEERY